MLTLGQWNCLCPQIMAFQRNNSRIFFARWKRIPMKVSNGSGAILLEYMSWWAVNMKLQPVRLERKLVMSPRLEVETELCVLSVLLD